ncbi:MAG: glycosyltransferase family 25 protein [Micavibrio sp.]|nr:glycosyltransferase family 25 protein [Micavibrio sp.]
MNSDFKNNVFEIVPSKYEAAESRINTLIISMKCDHARRAAMESHLQERGFQAEFFDAIDGRQMDVLAHPDYLRPKRLAAHGRDLKGGELGCMLSHRAAYHYILDKGYKHALLLEDDTRLAPEAKQVLESFLAKNIDYDIIRLMGSPKVMRSKQRIILPLLDSRQTDLSSEQAQEPTNMDNYLRSEATHSDSKDDRRFYLTRMSTTPGGAHATLISRAGAQKLVRATEKFAFPIDTVLGRCWETGINAYSIKPAMAVPDEENFQTTIGDARHDKNIHLKGLDKLRFKVGRPVFKLKEAIGKKKQFKATEKPDLALSQKFS